MSKEHAPSRFRAIIKDSRSGKGRTIDKLIEDARSLSDPYYVTLALFGLSYDERLGGDAARTLAEQALETVGEEKRPWRRAELLTAICKTARARADRKWLRDTIMQRVTEFPKGQGLSDAITGSVRYLGCGSVPSLLAMGAGNKGFEQETCKAVIRYWGQDCASTGLKPEELLTALAQVQDKAIRTRLLGYLHVQLMRSGHVDLTVLERALECTVVLSGGDRLEGLKYLAAQSSTLEELEMIAMGLTELDSPVEEARLFASLAGNADKTGHRELALDWFMSGLDIITEVEDKNDRASVRLNLATGLRRLGEPEAAESTFRLALGDAEGNEKLTAKVRKAMGVEPERKGRRSLDTEPHAPRHMLALYDTYEGGLKPVHFRMVARAAPLCIAYGLDLALMGFPVDDLEEFVEQVLADTNIGKGGRYLKELVKAGRVSLVRCTQKLPPKDWSELGMPVATTSRPTKDKVTSPEKALEQARSQHPRKRLCLIMGLGRKGLPRPLLDSVDHHLELTGRNIPLETATAMGIIARELGRLE